MTEPPGCLVKLERAKVHIGDLEARIAAFREGRPYHAVFNGHVEDGFAHYGVVGVGRLPIVWSAIAGDVLHNLRSGLDHAWKGIRRLDGHDGNFPILSAEGFEAGLKRTKQPATKKAVEILDTANAYKAGCLLSTIAEMNNIDKHEDLILVASRLADHGDWSAGPNGAGAFLGQLEPNTVLARLIGPSGHIDEEYELPFEVTFNQAGIVQGQAVLPTLRHCAGSVEDLLKRFHSAGLIP